MKLFLTLGMMSLCAGFVLKDLEENIKLQNKDKILNQMNERVVQLN